MANLRVCSAYRTVATAALEVIAASIPIDRVIEERSDKFRNEEGKQADRERRRNTMERWQEEWQGRSGSTWTATLIPQLDIWVNRPHGEVNYWVTQFLTGHGCFAQYLNRFKVRDTDKCWYCGGRDTELNEALFEMGFKKQ
ncbi:uncharacterized protein [Euwallacea similis]|uniref:uncharacterized protein n=1 Tax=Euwallacea similis TaxID=1736056 RepID=UPI00344D65A8